MNPIRIVTHKKTDISGYLSGWTGMQRCHYLAFRLKWANDTTVCQELSNILHLKASEYAENEKWRIPKDRDYCREFANMAVFEFRTPYKLDTGQKRAAYIKLDKSRWYRLWGSRYEQLYRHLDDWSAIAFSAIWKNQEET